MEIGCEHVWREVSNYLESEVGADLRVAMEEHLRGCKRCTAVLDGTRNVLQLVGDERVLEVPVGFEKRLRLRLQAEQPAARRNNMTWWVWATAAALLVGALAIGNGSAFREPHLRAEMAHPAASVPAALMVFVAEDGKTFHVAGCRFLRDKAKVRSIPAGEAVREGYAPCVYCMKQYLSAQQIVPTNEQAVGKSREVSEPEIALK